VLIGSPQQRSGGRVVGRDGARGGRRHGLDEGRTGDARTAVCVVDADEFEAGAFGPGVCDSAQIGIGLSGVREQGLAGCTEVVVATGDRAGFGFDGELMHSEDSDPARMVSWHDERGWGECGRLGRQGPARAQRPTRTWLTAAKPPSSDGVRRTCSTVAVAKELAS